MHALNDMSHTHEDMRTNMVTTGQQQQQQQPPPPYNDQSPDYSTHLSTNGTYLESPNDFYIQTGNTIDTKFSSQYSGHKFYLNRNVNSNFG